MTRTVEQIVAHTRNDTRKRQARIVLRKLADGSAFEPLALPGIGNIMWSLPQEIGAALRQVEARLSCERGVVRRHAAGAWFLKPNPFLINCLLVLRVALRWLRRHEHQAWAEAAE